MHKVNFKFCLVQDPWHKVCIYKYYYLFVLIFLNGRSNAGIFVQVFLQLFDSTQFSNEFQQVFYVVDFFNGSPIVDVLLSFG